MATQRRGTLTATLVAIAVSAALVLSQVTGAAMHSLVAVVNTVIGIGGGSDSFSERLPTKLNNTFVPPGYTYIGTEYPATLDMTRSVRDGMPVLHGHLTTTLTTTSGKILVGGYSEGALLVEQLKRDVARSPSPPSPLVLSFLEIATPFIPNGGIFARFPGLTIPGIIPGLAVPGMGPAQPTQYNTTYVINEYDTFGDFPAYLNPVALINAVFAHFYTHVDTFYDSLDLDDPANIVKQVPNGASGTDTYVLVPNKQLPLLAPLRDIARALHLTPVTERLLGAIEPLLRVMVDMAFTDRELLSPGIHQPFSLITPLHKIIEALIAVPGAVREGVENLLGVERQPVVRTVTTPAAVEAPPAERPMLRSVPTAGFEAEPPSSELDEVSSRAFVESTLAEEDIVAEEIVAEEIVEKPDPTDDLLLGTGAEPDGSADDGPSSVSTLTTRPDGGAEDGADASETAPRPDADQDADGPDQDGGAEAA